MFASEHTASANLVGVGLRLGGRQGGTMSVKRGKPQGRLVNIHKSSQLRAWAKYWYCTQQDVRDAVRTAGVTAEDVRDWLKINVTR